MNKLKRQLGQLKILKKNLNVLPGYTDHAFVQLFYKSYLFEMYKQQTYT